MMHSSPIRFPGHLYHEISLLLAALPDAQLWWKILACCLFAILGGLVFTPRLPLKNKLYRILSSRWLFAIVAAIAILLLRIPHLVLPELNVDESQWLASAATFWKSTYFWLSVEGTTGGPLTIIPPNLVNLLGGKLNYASVRLLALLLMIIPTALLIYRTLAEFFEEPLARAGVLPLFVVYATLTYRDFAAYNAEHTAFALLAAALFLSCKIIHKTSRRHSVRLVAAALICGLVPFAKLQAAPIALALAAITGWFYFANNHKSKGVWKNLTLFILAGLAPTFIVIGYVLSTGAWHHFWESYVINNLAYAQRGLYGNNQSLSTKLFLTDYTLGHLLNLGQFFTIQKWLFLALILPGLIASIKIKQLRGAVLTGIILVLAAFFSVAQPGNYFPHYYLLLLPFIVFVNASLMATLIRLLSQYLRKKYISVAVMSLFIVVSSIIPFYELVRGGHPGISYLKKGHYLHKSAVSKKINEVVAPGEPLAVWGWVTYYYVETEAIQATREPHTYQQINKSPQQDYYQQRYIHDLEKNSPKILIDVTGPDDLFFSERAKYRHENFPAINSYITQNYRFMAEIDSVRIYERRTKD